MSLEIGNIIQLDNMTLEVMNAERGGTATIFFAHSENGRNYIVKISDLNEANFKREQYMANLAANYCSQSPFDWKCTEEGLSYSGQLASDLISLSEFHKYFYNISTTERCLKALSVVKSILIHLSNLHNIKIQEVPGGIVHFDLSFSNIFFSKNDMTAYIIDYGSARIMPEEGKKTFNLDDFPCGTNPFVSPTRLWSYDNTILDCTEDLYSVGMILFCLIADGTIYKDPRFSSEFYSRSNCFEIENVIFSLADITAGVKKAFSSFLKKACAWNPEDRFPNARVMLEGVNELIEIVEKRGIHAAIACDNSEALYEKIWSNTYTNSSRSFSEALICTIEETEGDFVENFCFEEFTNTIIIGAGGSGKTTLALRLWEKLLDNWKQAGNTVPLPLYIPLFSYNDYCKSDRDYIKHEIYKLYFYAKSEENDKKQNGVNDDYALSIIDFLKETACLLILDGINESNCPSNLSKEIHELADIDCVRILISSRVDYNWLSSDKFERKHLLPLTDEAVIELIADRKLNTEIDSRTLELLKTPMFLALYTQIMPSLGNEIINEVKTAGELLKQHDAWLISQKKASGNEVEEYELRLVLDELLTAIAYSSNDRMFDIDLDPDDESFCLITKAIKHCGLLEKSKNNIVDLIEKYLIPAGIIYEISDSSCNIKDFVFVHEQYLLYYKAKYIYRRINDVKERNKRAKSIQIPECLYENALDADICKMLGDLLGETTFDKEQNNNAHSPVEDILHMKGFLEGKGSRSAQIAILNFVEVLKSSHLGLFDFDFSNLDLSLCSFANNSVCYSNFEKSTIGLSCFFDNPDCVEILVIKVADNGTVITISYDGVLNVLDASTHTCCFSQKLLSVESWCIADNLLFYQADPFGRPDPELSHIGVLDLTNNENYPSIPSCKGVFNLFACSKDDNSLAACTVCRDYDDALEEYEYIKCIEVYDPSSKSWEVITYAELFREISGQFDDYLCILSPVSMRINNNRTLQLAFENGCCENYILLEVDINNKRVTSYKELKSPTQKLIEVQEDGCAVWQSGNELWRWDIYTDKTQLVFDAIPENSNVIATSLDAKTAIAIIRCRHSPDYLMCWNLEQKAFSVMEVPPENYLHKRKIAIAAEGKKICILGDYFAYGIVCFDLVMKMKKLVIKTSCFIPVGSHRYMNVETLNQDNLLLTEESNDLISLFNGQNIESVARLDNMLGSHWINDKEFVTWNKSVLVLHKRDERSNWHETTILTAEADQLIADICIADYSGEIFALLQREKNPLVSEIRIIDCYGKQSNCMQYMLARCHSFPLTEILCTPDGNYLVGYNKHRNIVYSFAREGTCYRVNHDFPEIEFDDIHIVGEKYVVNEYYDLRPEYEFVDLSTGRTVNLFPRIDSIDLTKLVFSKHSIGFICTSAYDFPIVNKAMDEHKLYIVDNKTECTSNSFGTKKGRLCYIKSVKIIDGYIEEKTIAKVFACGLTYNQKLYLSRDEQTACLSTAGGEIYIIDLCSGDVTEIHVSNTVGSLKGCTFIGSKMSGELKESLRQNGAIIE